MENDYYEVHENEYITNAEREEVNEELAQREDDFLAFQDLLTRFYRASRGWEMWEMNHLFHEICEMYKNKR